MFKLILLETGPEKESFSSLVFLSFVSVAVSEIP